MQHILEPLLQETGVPLLLLDKKQYQVQLAECIREKEITVVLMMTFPFLITPELLALPPKGFINFHYGLLPQCRGPQPVLRHLLNNDAEAGVTVHRVDEGIDTGPVILLEKMPIEPNDTYGLLQSKLAFLAAKLSASLLKILSYGTVIPSLKQDESKAAYYEMPKADELTINWQDMTASQINRLVNACNPWNKGAGATINNWVIGITEVEIIDTVDDPEMKPGTIISCDRSGGCIVRARGNQAVKLLVVYTSEGFFSGGRMADFGLKAGMQFS
ncbi:MAG: hypothetical protein IPI66_01075 [Chitinophagaceae bacterium]|nr:hypothetical protein [Chitinophagaceae bacterium]